MLTTVNNPLSFRLFSISDTTCDRSKAVIYTDAFFQIEVFDQTRKKLEFLLIYTKRLST